MGIDAAQVLRGKVRKNFTHLLCLNIFWPSACFIAMAIALSGPSKADELPRQAVKELIIHYSGESQHVDPALALAVARILSNFNAAAIGPAQRVGVFQLDHERLAGAHNKADLLDPYLNIKIGLQNLNHLIKINDGDIATGLADFNNGLAIGPWPNTRILDTPFGFVANVFAARAVFQKELASHHHATRKPMQLSLYTSSGPDDILYIDSKNLNLPRWRKKILETLYWLGEAERIKRAQTW
jgi:hypothetical protein